jgi:hypothetical protein
VSANVEAHSGLFWNVFMVDAESLYFIASWDTAQMNDIQVNECCDLLAEVMRKLGSEENWLRSVGSVFKSGKERNTTAHEHSFPEI